MGQIQHAFYKEDANHSHEINERALANTPSAADCPTDRFETPVITMSRILGDRFWDLKDKEDDVLVVVMETEGCFDIDTIKGAGTNGAQPIVQFINSIFNGFVQVSPKLNVPIPIDFASQEVAKLHVTTNDGMYTNMVSMSTFRDLWHYNKNGEVETIKEQDKIIEYVNAIEKNQQSIQRMRSMNNPELVQRMQKEILEYNQKVVDIWQRAIENFFNIIEKTANVNIKDVYDVSFVISRVLEDPSGKVGSMKETDVISMRDASYNYMVTLQHKFGIA